MHFQGHRDQSVTFGFREGNSTLDIRTSGAEEDLEAHRREVYVRRPTSRTSNPESDTIEAATPPGGPFGHKNFRMIDASACDLRDPTDRNRKDSITSIVSGIVMNEQYSRQMALQQQQVAKSQGTTGGRSRHSSITSTSTMRSNKQQVVGGSYAIETSFCGAKPLINPSTYDLSQHAQDEELGNQSPRYSFYTK